MLKKIFKIVFIALGSFVLLLGVFFAFIYFNVDGRMHKTYAEFPEESYPVPDDSASIALGAHLTLIKGCQECHGADLSGKIMIDDKAMGRLSTTNLTSGKGGRGHYTTEQWIKALRHGVNAENKPLLFMPSHETVHLSQQDLMAIVAYCKSLPPVDHVLPENAIGPLARVLTYFEKLPLIPVEMIDHSQKALAEVDKTVSADYGKYLATACTGCHGNNFKGGDPHIPGSPQVADLTSTSHIAKWTEEQFIQTLRTGKTPEGKQMQNEFMPWQMTKAYSDDELKSLYLFLKEQP